MIPYLCFCLRYGSWELYDVIPANDPQHAFQLACTENPDAIEWIIVPTEHVYRKATT